MSARAVTPARARGESHVSSSRAQGKANGFIGACPYGCTPHPPPDQFIDEVAEAVRIGDSVAEVRRRWHIYSSTHYRWLQIGRGHLTHWWDGCPIDPLTARACWRLAIGVARARLEYDQQVLRRLADRQPL